jgi:Na+:H+ antiporter, NhaA family
MLVRLRRFAEMEAAGGIVLFAAAVLALVLANSVLGPVYEVLLDLPVSVQIGALKVAKPLLLWVNDGLMAVFFMVVGLEVKREVLEGSLSTLRGAATPSVAAIGSMAVPALVYVACSGGDPALLHGWAIPAAIDIAFPLGVLALLGSRLPRSSGVHATLAGLLVDFAVPLTSAVGGSPSRRLEHDMHPWVALVILPIFAFANAGVRFADIAVADLLHPVQLGVALGLLIGKPLGAIGAVWATVRTGLGTLPEGARWSHVYGVAALTGIRFTMSLFISTLAFPFEGYDADIRLAVLLGSAASAIAGYALPRRTA